MESLENIEPNKLRILSPQSSQKETPSKQRTPSSNSVIRGRVLSSASDHAIGFESPLFEESYDTAHEHSGGKVRSVGRLGSLSSTWSPTLQKTHITLQSKIEFDHLKQELFEKDLIIKQQKEIIDQLLKEKQTVQERENMFTEDIQVKEFYISVQDQKISQLEEESSCHRLQYHDAISKIKKYKANLKKLEQEKQSFETKSKNMITQLNEQMVQLQSLAIERIQVLEQDIMKSRHENDQLRDQVSHLEKQLRIREDFFEPRQKPRTAKRFDSEDVDFITEDNYLDLNASTMSYNTVNTEVRSPEDEGVLCPEEDEELENEIEDKEEEEEEHQEH